jgi:acetoin utilization deacetylase AcuC-like enzyme
VGKVLIVDWDVHHGNGTQEIFYDDPSVFYFSTHQFPFYPGTGAREETGTGKGRGTTLNVPMKEGSGDSEYVAVFESELVPAVRKFAPEFILISAGFDAHCDDPLAAMQVTEEGFGRMSRIVRELADEVCDGKQVSLLEGGYDLGALARSVGRHLEELFTR